LIGMPGRRACLLRHTSFTRPIYVTSAETLDLDQLWERTREQLRSCGLPEQERPLDLTRDNASERLNLAFARALNAKLAGAGLCFDLVIVDEAQCLRNPGNQTNRVLCEALRGRVGKWLFMSATPVHGDLGDIPTILNHYPGEQVLDPELVRDLPRMQEALRGVMVRRQRRYRTLPASAMVGKEVYRSHDLERWGLQEAEMSALGTLAMGLVQKRLVGVLQGRSNRYRVGFLSSFESLQSSIGRMAAPSDAAPEEEQSGDWHRDPSEGQGERDAPDAGFISALSEDFAQRFGRPLPHPKLDFVVDRVAPLVFGTDEEEGGDKLVIFARRVSTVHALRDRLMARSIRAIEARMERCWVGKLDWSGGEHGEAADASADEAAQDADEAAEAVEEAGDNPLRAAMALKGWLFRYRQTFRASGRSALFFEDGWWLRLCEAGGVAPQEAAAKLSKALWAESWTHAARGAASQQQYRAARVRYLAVQAVRREPEVFGLSVAQAAPWREAYEAALHEHVEQAQPASEPHCAPQLLTQPTLWTAWDARFRGSALELPGASPSALGASDGADVLCRRQVARSLLGQTFRLTDTLLDLFFADAASRRGCGEHAEVFLDWLTSQDPGARQLRRDCARWLAQLRLIVDSCLEGAGRPWRELAREERWPQLYNPMAVVGVTGGAGSHQSALRQFRTPSNPRVIVCTDTLKEGVDLHLFCDQVLHYGVAWTSGDLEQRVGRVDRFFSQIERRLSVEGAPPDVALHVGYPHVVASLERAQVTRVIARQRRAEALMDSPLGGALELEEREFVVGASAPRADARRALEPYRPRQTLVPRRSIVVVSAAEARQRAAHYTRWYSALHAALGERGWHLSPGDAAPVRVAKLYGLGRTHALVWSFDTALDRYVLTCSGPASLAGAAPWQLRPVGKKQSEAFMRVLVPTPEEGADMHTIHAFLDALTVA
jgi:hypothetical protein